VLDARMPVFRHSLWRRCGESVPDTARPPAPASMSRPMRRIVLQSMQRAARLVQPRPPRPSRVTPPSSGRRTPYWVAMTSPSATRRWHARTSGRPFTTMRQSKHTPIPQKMPRGRPLRRVVRQDVWPSSWSTAATVWPLRAVTGLPSTVMFTPPARGWAGRRGTAPGRGGAACP
jgi:hypothetical protein